MARRSKRPVRCSTCLAELGRDRVCPVHGQRQADGSSSTPAASRGQRFPAEPLTPAEVEQLIAACSHRSPTGIRNRAIVATLYRTGIRCGELVALRPKDIDREAGTLTVLHGKGNERRTVAIDATALAYIDRWLETRRAKLGISRHGPVFCTLTRDTARGVVVGTPLSTHYVRHMLPRLARRAGIAKRVHPHGLRHTLAFELAMEGKPLPVVQSQLGHANSSTTAAYIEHLAPRQLLEAMRDREWLPAS
jgi:integrase/recombinase XerD